MKLGLGLTLFILAVSFNSCSPYKSITSSNSSLSSTKLGGEELYAIHCASCHQPLESSTKRNRTFEQIEVSMKNVLQMKEIPSLVVLTPDQLKLIAEALNAVITSGAKKIP